MIVANAVAGVPTETERLLGSTAARSDGGDAASAALLLVPAEINAAKIIAVTAVKKQCLYLRVLDREIADCTAHLHMQTCLAIHTKGGIRSNEAVRSIIFASSIRLNRVFMTYRDDDG